jgi:polysaccharide deacetylase family protein (PEP-CTERM system associated)
MLASALTVDVEDYFQIEAFARTVRYADWPSYAPRVGHNTRRLLDMMDSHRAVGTFFVLGWVADRDPGLVREIASRGHELACHGYAHRPLWTMAMQEVREDVRRAKATIEDTAGVRVAGYRAPTFSVTRQTLWALDILAELGFDYDSSIFPIRHDRYGIPDAPRFPHRVRLRSGAEIIEFPMTTFPVGRLRLPFSGGGYLRLLPYPLVRHAMRYVTQQERRPAIVYLHPWEIDPDQPRLAERWPTRMRHYTNLHRTEGKIGRLLKEFKFTTATDVLGALDLASVAP